MDLVLDGMIIERRAVQVDLPPEYLFRVFTGLGGERGWLSMNWAWKIRGALDLLAGGPGFRRGRRDPDHLHGYALYPVHAAVFGNLVRCVADRARSLAPAALPRSTP